MPSIRRRKNLNASAFTNPIWRFTPSAGQITWMLALVAIVVLLLIWFLGSIKSGG